MAKLPIVKRDLAARSHGRRTGFVERFASCPEILAAKSILCLGARTGEEVAALYDHGVLAVGVDLLPGDDRYVLRGDWHALEFPDESFEAVYGNAFDHARDLDAVLKEVDRVLAPGGVFLLDIAYGFDEGRPVGPFESLARPAARDLADEVGKVTGSGWSGSARSGSCTWTVGARRSTASRQSPTGQRELRSGAVARARAGRVALPRPRTNR